MRHTSIVASLLALGAMIAVSCGGSDDELAKAIEDLPRSALSTMVLTAEEFGRVVEGFEIDSDSGVSDNADAAEGSMTPDDDAGDFDDAGRITGYGLSFSVIDIVALVAAGEGVGGVESEVDLFQSANEASADTERKIEELHTFEDRSIDGLILGAHEEFDVAGLGDESGGIEFTGDIEGLDLSIYVTVVYFRIGRLNAAVVFSAFDDQNLRDEAEAAAKKLEARIKGVALGEIDEDPIEIPSEASEPTTNEPAGGPGEPVDRPDGVPDLASVALQLSDLPAGFEIAEEGYEAAPEQEFSREFRVADGVSIRIGQTEVAGVQNTVTVAESAVEAGLFMTLFEQFLTGEQGREFFASRFAEGAGFEPEVLKLESQPLEVGDEGIVILGLIRTGLGDFALAFMVVRVDRAVALVNVTALASSFNLEDVIPLAQLEAERLRAGPPN